MFGMDFEYLERIGAAQISDTDGKLHPTVAGLLMFGEEYKIRYEFPEYFLDYREMLDPSIRWTDRLESSSGEWSGNLYDFFFNVEKKLLMDIKVPFQKNGISRNDETPVHFSLREALANCMANADFNFPRGIVIKKDINSIVIENPGSIIVGKNRMLKMFNLIRIGERAGSGVPDIFTTWNNEGWIAPEVEEHYNPDRTILRLSFINKKESPTFSKVGEKVGDDTQNINSKKTKAGEIEERKVMILEILRENPHISANDIALKMNITRGQVEKTISSMKKEGKIKRIGSARTGEWIVL